MPKKLHELKFMMSLSHPYHRSTLALLFLLAAGYVGNYFSLSLFFGVDFLFGSIAVLLVVRLFGIRWGTLAAVIAGTHTVFLWNHPYAAIVLTLEALFVGLLLRRQRQNMVLLDVIYWVLIGMPLLWLFYSRLLHLDATQTLLVMFKQSVNGIFNALVASLIVTYFPIHKWVGRPQVNNTPSLQQTLLNLLVAFIFFPTLMLMILDGHRVISNMETDIQAELKSTSIALVAEMRSWHKQHLRALNKLEQAAVEFDMAPSDILQQSTELMQRVFPDFHNIYVANATGTTIASYPKQGLTIALDASGKSIAEETKTALQPLITDVHADRSLPFPHVHLSLPVFVDNRFRGSIYSSLNLSYISQLLKLNTGFQGSQITLVDSKSRIVASTQSDRVTMQNFDRRRGGEIRAINNKVYQWIPDKAKMPPMARWKKSFYVQEIAIDINIPWTLVVEVPAVSYISYLQSLYINDLGIMLLIAMLAIVFAVALSRRLAKPLSKLAHVTTNLPNKLLEREAINWPNSPVTEIDSLVRNFKLMAIALNEKFRELQRANETLEYRVQERTVELLQANKKLASEITERQQTEEALRESEERFRQMAENIHEVFWMTNVDKNERIYISPAYEEIWGRTCASLYEQSSSFLDAIHPEDRERVLAALPKEIQGDYDQEYRIVRPDGSIRWIHDRAFPIRNEFKEVYRIAGIAADITYRVQAEAEICYALEKEIQLNDLKSRFITTASHEFRTPLTAIFMAAKLLEQFGSQATEEKKRLYLDRIQAATKHMTRLLDDVLLIGKAEAGKLEFNPAPLELEKFCRELVEEMQLSAGSKHAIAFTSFGEYTTVCLDEKLLRHILSNLLSNAIKYSPQGGNVNFDLIWEQGEVIFRIQDQGIGIPVADQEQLFNSFHRGSNVSTIPGTGLGMSIVKQCVDLHGGKITVNSEVGVGTTFIVTLPISYKNLP